MVEFILPRRASPVPWKACVAEEVVETILWERLDKEERWLAIAGVVG